MPQLREVKMPQLQVYDPKERPPEPTGVQKFFSNLGKSFKDKEDSDKLADILKEYGENQNNEMRYLKGLESLERSNISPSKRLEAQKYLSEFEKLNSKKSSQTNQKLSAYETELQKKGAAETIKLEERIPAYRDTLANIDRMEELSKKHLSGGKGFVKSFLGTQSAKELDTLGASALDTTIKRFNPAGTLPTAKLNWIRQTFAPQAAENPSGRQGKINNLRKFTIQAQRKDEERLALLKKYQGNIPPEIEDEFNRIEYLENEALASELDFNELIKDKKDDDLIEGFYDASSGEELNSIPKKEAVELFNAGVITNVPPG